MKYVFNIFLDPEFDLSTLSQDEVLQFYKFAENAIILYKRNVYFKGFWQNLYNIMNGV